MIGSHTKSLAN